jgi:hypothetical protein
MFNFIKSVLRSNEYSNINSNTAKQSLALLRTYKNRFKGKTIYCVGNGPSLATEDVSLLKNENLILTNSGFKILDKCEPGFACSIVQDTWRYQSLNADLKTLSIPVFYSCHEPSMVKKNIAMAKKEWVYLKFRWKSTHIKLGFAGGLTFDTTFDFSDNIEETFYGGYSVIFGAIQLAYYMGASKIVLLGVDMDFSGSQKHFDPTIKHIFPGDYNYEKLAKPHFIACRDKLNQLGVELVDATTNGKIDVLPKTSLQQLH